MALVFQTQDRLSLHMCSYTDVQRDHLLLPLNETGFKPTDVRIKCTFGEGGGLVVFLLNVDTGVAGTGIGGQWPGSSKTVCVLVENDIALILDELFR